jgi:hypothetical protein
MKGNGLQLEVSVTGMHVGAQRFLPKTAVPGVTNSDRLPQAWLRS